MSNSARNIFLQNLSGAERLIRNVARLIDDPADYTDLCKTLGQLRNLQRKYNRTNETGTKTNHP
jgi:hypothetical protein